MNPLSYRHILATERQFTALRLVEGKSLSISQAARLRHISPAALAGLLQRARQNREFGNLQKFRNHKKKILSYYEEMDYDIRDIF